MPYFFSLELGSLRAIRQVKEINGIQIRKEEDGLCLQINGITQENSTVSTKKTIKANT